MAAQSTLTKQANALVTLFIKTYTEKHKRKPEINRFKQKWGFEAMISDLGYDEAKEVMSYFFDNKRADHPVNDLLYNYETLAATLAEIKDDERKRLELRAATAKRVKEWEERGNTGIEGN